MNSWTKIELLNLLVAFWIVGGHEGAFPNKIVYQIDGHRTANVVGMWFKGKTPNCDSLLF